MQLDIEASFVEPEDVYGFIGEAVGDATEAVTGARPHIERLPWVEAMERFGVDKPDLRFGMELTELTGLFAATEFNAFRAGTIKGIRVPGKAEELGRNKLDGLTDKAKQLGAKGLVWMKVKAGGELDSPVAKFLSDEEKQQLVVTLDAEPGDLLLIVADDERRLVQDVLGQLRNDLGRPPVSEGPYRFVWVTEFPMFDGRDDAGNPQAAHHPFTMPHPDDLDLLETDPMRVRSQAYDLVLNGSELGSGSIRIHRSDIQARVFTALGISDEEAESRFGFLLGAFKYGAPPHGGFAVGLDRFVAILAGEDNIREVIAFPKASSGIDPMTGAPKEVDPKVLADVGLRPLPPPK
jgi:aspartyl-tRNA synthetase